MQSAWVLVTNSGRQLALHVQSAASSSRGLRRSVGCHIDDRMSQGGYVFLMGGAAISWKSYTISMAARPTPESEYVAAIDTGAEAIFPRNFLDEVDVPPASRDADLHRFDRHTQHHE